ncbi:translation elongation factor Ts [candidate division WWE3 bacterium]|nr:translation elongation factor Ts [candidate division WWE3 bacterium]
MDQIKQLREETGAGVMDAKQALEAAGGNYQKALEELKAKGIARAAKKADRTTQSGTIYAYVHGEGQMGAMIELNCETSFVAKTDEFKKLAHEICLQIVSMNPENVDQLLSQEYIRDSKKTIKDLISELISKTGENMTLRRFTRYQLGEE